MVLAPPNRRAVAPALDDDTNPRVAHTLHGQDLI